MSKIDAQINISLPKSEREAIVSTAGKLEIPISLFCRKALKQKIQSFQNNQDFEKNNLSFFEGGL